MRIYLSGNSKNRRKQLRKIRKEYQNHYIRLLSTFTQRKKIDGRWVTVEDANKPLTLVIIEEKNDNTK